MPAKKSTRKPAAKSGYKKRAVPKARIAQAQADRSHTEVLMAYSSNVTKACLDDAYAPIAGKSSCVENIAISPKAHSGFETNWNRMVKDKYEEYKVVKFEARIMFSNVEQPVLFIIDDDSKNVGTPKQIVNDPAHGLKMLKENDNSLTITWRPKRGSSDNDYLPVKAFDDADFGSALAHLKILQHNLDKAVGQPGCTMQLKATVACKGLQNAQGTALTDAQIAALETLN